MLGIGGGYYNPTQAGALCGSNGEFLIFPKDNGKDNGLIFYQSGNQYDFLNAQLMNFDYGDTYQGPYNNNDRFKLNQKVTAFNDFLEIEYNYSDDSGRGFGVLQTPTIYLHHIFNSLEYSINNQVTEQLLINPASIFDTQKWNEGQKFIPNNYDYVVLKSPNGINLTFVSIPSKTMKGNSVSNGQNLSNVTLTAGYKRVNLSLNQTVKFPRGVEITAWFLMIPGLPSEVINTPFGTMQVDQFILEAKQYYGNLDQSLRYVQGQKPIDKPIGGLPLKFTSSRANTVEGEKWNPLNAIDSDLNTCYSSKIRDQKAFLGMWFDGFKYLSTLEIIPRVVNGVELSYPPEMDIFVTSEDNKQWEFVARINKSTKIIKINKKTAGVLLSPVKLGVDDFKNEFFQICELIAK